MDVMKRYKTLDTARHFEGCTPQNRASPYTPRPDDIIVAGHPKSGTTWMQQILHQLRTGGTEDFASIYDVVLFLPSHNMKTDQDLEAEHVANPRVYQTHCLYEDVPKLEGINRFVVVIRDPYDSEYSMTRFLWRMYGADRDVTPDEYLEMQEEWHLPQPGSFVQSWWPHRNDSNVFFMPYEYWKKDLPSRLQELHQFLFGHEMEEPEFSRVSRFCSFEYMKENRNKFNGDRLAKFWGDLANLEFMPGKLGMVRPDGGQVGQGVERLDERVKAYIDKGWMETVGQEFELKNYQELYKKWSEERNMKSK